MIARIPYYRQQTTYTCGPAVLRMLAGALGRPVSERRLSRLCLTSAKRGTPNTVMAILGKALLGVRTYPAATWKQLESALEHGHPVVVNYREPGEEAGHYAIAVGLNDEAIVLFDPWHGPRFSLPVEEFRQRWLGHRTRRADRGWMMVLAPTKRKRRAQRAVVR